MMEIDPPLLRAHDSSQEAPRRYPSLRKFCLMESTIVEPLLLFCTHAIRMRDSRCCNIILRVFRSIVPDFHITGPAPAREEPPRPPGEDTDGYHHSSGVDQHLDTSPIAPEAAAAIREYIASDVLRACITSLHEPYFVDLQKELAALIAAIIVYYSPLTKTPRNILLSLPNVKEADVDRLSEYMAKPGSHTRQQRALVLDLLKDLKGVSIAEMGKLPKSAGFGNSSRSKKTGRSKMAQEFMTAQPANAGTDGNAAGGRTNTPDGLEGVAGLFGGGAA
jgi:exportin-5